MKRNVFVVLAAAGLVAGCDGLKEAMTAHVDRVAQAGTQELSVTRLAELLGKSRVPLRRDVAKTLADIWVDYQLLAHSAARGDSLNDPKVVDQAMWSQIAGAKAKKWYEQISKGWSVADSGQNQKRYDEGQLLAARHILLMAPKANMPQPQRDSVRAQLEALRPRVSGANFTQMAQQYTQEPGGKERGGDLGLFPKGAMVPEFQKAVLALQPGQVSGVVETEYGYHLIYRPRFDEVREKFQAQIGDVASAAAESTYLANLEKAANVEIKPGAAPKIRAVVADLDAHANDDDALATFKGGRFTSADLARWVAAYPPQANLPQQIAGAPDSLLPRLVKNFIRNQLVLKQADSAGVNIDPAELAQIRQGFTSGITQAWMELGIDPKSLADSGRSVAERERYAAARIDDYLDKLLAQQARFVDIPKPVQLALRKKYESDVNGAGLDRAVERATKIRASADSAAAANEPKSAVPMPGGAPGAPQPAQPAPQAPPQTKRP